MSTQWSSLKASTFPAWFSSQMHCWTKMTNKRHFVVWRSSCPVISFCNVGFKFRNFSLQSRFNIEILNENFWVKQDDRNQGLVQELFIKRKKVSLCIFGPIDVVKLWDQTDRKPPPPSSSSQSVRIQTVNSYRDSEPLTQYSTPAPTQPTLSKISTFNIPHTIPSPLKVCIPRSCFSFGLVRKLWKLG